MCVCVQTSHLYSSVDGYLGCFHFLAIVNNAAMNIYLFELSFSLVI